MLALSFPFELCRVSILLDVGFSRTLFITFYLFFALRMARVQLHQALEDPWMVLIHWPMLVPPIHEPMLVPLELSRALHLHLQGIGRSSLLVSDARLYARKVCLGSSFAEFRKTLCYRDS